VLTNSGDYDWVLSEITQADDYNAVHSRMAKSPRLNERVRRLIDENEDFSVQMIEDRASNGYLQILAAIALGEPAMMRRFVGDDAFETARRRMESGPFAYNRIYLNDVSLIAAGSSEGRNVIAIAVKSSYQRVSLDGGAVRKIDPAVSARTDVVLMSRDADAGSPKGELYQHTCPSCGGPLQDTLDTRCTYCGSEINSTSHDWIITGIMSVSEYKSYLARNKGDFPWRIDPGKAENQYGNRDYAINNMLVVMAANGDFNPAERRLAVIMAKKLGFNTDRIDPLFEMAKSGRLVIRMPENPNHRRRIYALMEKAASADNAISTEERTLLDGIRQQYGIGGDGGNGAG
jgi:hypothetical protein